MFFIFFIAKTLRNVLYGFFVVHLRIYGWMIEMAHWENVFTKSEVRSTVV